MRDEPTKISFVIIPAKKLNIPVWDGRLMGHMLTLLVPLMAIFALDTMAGTVSTIAVISVFIIAGFRGQR